MSPHERSKMRLFGCGLVSGVIQAAIFNPWDRALYLSVKECRPFLVLENFRYPFTGLSQTIFQRSFSAGLYFPLEENFMMFFEYILCNTHISHHWISLLAGNCAGAINGLALNPLAAIKYHTWGIDECERENFFATAKKLYCHGGARPFVAGTFATVSRDMVFGGCFAVMRHGLQNKESTHNKFGVNMLAGFFATLLSSPLNYVRNMHYATPPWVKHKTASEVLVELWQNAKLEKNMFYRVRYLQQQLRVGWGTARVACGMALGSQIYEICTRQL